MSVDGTSDAWSLLKQAEAAGSDAAAWLKAAQALSRAGEKDAAERAFARYVEIAPGRKALSEGARRHQAGDIAEAARLYREALAVDPRNVDALRLLALACSAMGQRNDALQAAHQAASFAPNYAAAWDALGVVLSDCELVEDAVEAFARAASSAPQNPAAHMKLAHALTITDQMQDAERVYRQALLLQPDGGPILLGLGAVLKTMGRQEEAIACFRRCLEAQPLAGEAWWSLANLKTYRFSEADIAQMRQLVQSTVAAPASRANAYYALGKALEDAKQYDEAFAHYEQGAKLHRSMVAYDAGGMEALAERVVRVFSPEFVAARVGQGCNDPSPIFVLGMPRSGSTLVEQILASHSLVDGAGEVSIVGQLLNEMGGTGASYPELAQQFSAADFRSLGEEYLARVARRRGGAPYFVDKTPQNFGSVGLIALMLPNAKIIDARRHPMDSCFGSFKQFFAQGQTYSYDLGELGAFYLLYERMMQHWDRAAPGRVLRVDYEDVVLDQEQQTRRLLAFCGLPFEERCLRFHESDRAVNSASSEQVRQPLYRSAMGAWRRFAPHLRELEAQLAPALANLPPHIRDAGLQ
jgi:tetratricopeptide (TPR) repeat protein